MSASAPAVLHGGPGDGRRMAVRLDALELPPLEIDVREGLQVRALAAHVERGAPYVEPRTGVYRLQRDDQVPPRPRVDQAGDLVYAWQGWSPG